MLSLFALAAAALQTLGAGWLVARVAGIEAYPEAAALVTGTLDISRKALMPRLLSVANAEATLRRAFKSPHPSAPAVSDVSRVGTLCA